MARSIRDLQLTLPWTVKYSQDFRSNPQSHKDFAHACHHASKALGKLHGLADDMDHDRGLAADPHLREQYAKYVADLVVCALRMANVFPGGVVDLETAVVGRIEDKNNVRLPVVALPEAVPSETSDAETVHVPLACMSCGARPGTQHGKLCPVQFGDWCPACHAKPDQICAPTCTRPRNTTE